MYIVLNIYIFYCSHEIKRCLLLGRKATTKVNSILRSRDIFAHKSLYSQSYGFSGSQLWVWKLDHKEGWALKNWCFCTVFLEKTLVTPLDSKEIKPVNPKGNQRWIFTGRTDAGAEATILWPPDAKNWLIGKDPDPGKYWRWEEKGKTEDEVVGWNHQLNGHKFEQTLGDSERDRAAWCASVHEVAKSQTQLTKGIITTNVCSVTVVISSSWQHYGL